MTNNIKKKITTESTTVGRLVEDIDSGKYLKPKFQRKKKWTNIHSHMNDIKNIASNEKFICFLYDKKHTIHNISINKSSNNDNFEIVDGNNRINAIYNFVKKPLQMFPKYVEHIKTYLTNKNVPEDDINNIIHLYEDISYDEIIDYNKTTTFFKNKTEHNEDILLILNNNRKAFDDFEEELMHDIQEDFKIKDYIKSINFLVEIDINMVKFEYHSDDDCNKIFQEINKYGGSLTQMEMLASEYASITDFEITDKSIKASIIEHVEIYYNNNSLNECAQCYKFESGSLLNAFDFLVGFQNYLNSKCPIIPDYYKSLEQYKNDNTLLLNVWRVLFYDTVYDDKAYDKKLYNFTTNNINTFIKIMMKVYEILSLCTSNGLLNSLIENNQIFRSMQQRLQGISTSSILSIICIIIGFIKLKETKTYKINDNEISNIILCLIYYHKFASDVKVKEKKNFYLSKDILAYSNESMNKKLVKMTEYVKNPFNYFIIQKDDLKSLLKTLISENISLKEYETRKDNAGRLREIHDKRRKQKLFEVILLYSYFKNKVPYDYFKTCDMVLSIEHIVPFSSSWNGKLDRDRLGNITLMSYKANITRGNKHLYEYDKIHKCIIPYLRDIIPSRNNYDKIVNHDNKKPIINDNNFFNTECGKTEDVYIDTLIEQFFWNYEK